MTYLNGHAVPEIVELAGHLDDGEIVAVLLNEASCVAIEDEHAGEMARCYIDPDVLEQMATLNGLGIGEQLEELLPDMNHMRSGDFGEILSKVLLEELNAGAHFPVYRWRNRSNRNDTVRGTDLIGYIRVGGEPDANDTLIICEAKTRATNVEDDVVNIAMDGVRKDYASRLASSLHFSQKRLVEDGLNDRAKELARFRRAHPISFNTKLIAAVIPEDANWDDGRLEVLPPTHGLSAQVQVLVVCVEDLAGWIHSVYASIPVVAENDA